MSSQWDLLADVVPNDRAVQVDSTSYIRAEAGRLAPDARVLDLGCGTGGSVRHFRRVLPEVRWIGVDIASSPEVDARAPQEKLNFVTFDGIRLPFRDASFDCVYSHQVLEHVRHPETLLAEAYRVLEPGGSFIGSTSNLEPYHSFSLWNFTPYGFRVIVEDAGFTLEELRPGIDGPTIIQRQVLGRPPELSRFFVETSPLNAEIIEWGAETKRRPALVNNRMLQFCGQFAFLCRKT